jgi:hypothetical protein
MKRFLQLTFLAVSLAASLLPVAAQVRTYKVLSVDVPFKFNVGDRSFRPGCYQFIFVGTGLLMVRDARSHIVASLLTRSVETGSASPSTRLVFRHQKKHQHLAQIWIENHTQVLEILGEELAMRQAPPPPRIHSDVWLFSDRPAGLR